MKHLSITLLIILASTLPGLAQKPPDDDPIGRFLFSPDLIMAHSDELGIQEQQRASIKNEIQKAQSKFIDAQWEMKTETDRMVQLLQRTPADEVKILAQADKIMTLEREIKRTHLSMLIRLKNLLTAGQLAKLDAIRARG